MAVFLIMSFLCWGLLQESGGLSADYNVALESWTNQSSRPQNSGRAVDGNQNSIYGGGSCTHSFLDNPAWWGVDLGRSHRISRVRIINRQDCCADRLQGAQVRIGNVNHYNRNEVCDTIYNPQADHTIHCDNMEGRYVFIVITGRSEYLTLCEVEVYGVPIF